MPRNRTFGDSRKPLPLEPSSPSAVADAGTLELCSVEFGPHQSSAPPAVGASFRFPTGVWTMGLTNAPATVIDAFMIDVARQYGYRMDQLSHAVLTVALPLANTAGSHGDVALSLTILREKHGAGFIARANIGAAFGHGGSVGEAVNDYLTDLAYRWRTLEAAGDRLGPCLQAERRELESLLNRTT